ncbi:gamma carbonic anhydrase family protein [Chitinimonas sp.]|uniref:gamma carbonic anhydrase family protein n=1 Tax=Chitinimonas sp. TaxID=1934313 RepID=UPI0035B0F67D
MALRRFKGVSPTVPESAFVDETAVVVGDVVLGENASIWPGAIVRGDVNHIRIGRDSNVQDLACLHVSHKRDSDPEGAPLIIGERVTIGHQVTLHGCTIGDEVLIGIGSIVLDRAVIQSQVMIGAGSLVPPGKVLESGYLYVGRPAKPVRPLSEEELAHFNYSAAHYIRLMRAHQES